jgi:N-terminal region of Chorein or VPS13
MFSSIAEGYIQKICGKYLKNFSAENINIGVTGIITITDVEVKTEELINFQLPYKPSRLFIGTLYADLPFVSGGNFDVRISDVLFVVEKSDENLPELHPYELQRVLQMWIGAFYLNLANISELKAAQSISSSEIEYVQKLTDRLCITVENLHFRAEEMFTAHVPCPIGEDTLCLGTIISKIELRPPSSQELSEVTDGKPSWNLDGDTQSTRVINKLLKCTNISSYCTREDCISSITTPLTTAIVRERAWHRVKGQVLASMNLVAKFSGAYQRTNLVFGPVTLSINVDGVDFHVTDEQLSFLGGVAVAFETHAHKYVL